MFFSVKLEGSDDHASLDRRALKETSQVCADVGVVLELDALHFVVLNQTVDPGGNGEVSDGDVVADDPIVAFELLIQNLQQSLRLLRVTFDCIWDLIELG